jgi:enoyl-CoA hydratase/carnithine racemase
MSETPYEHILCEIRNGVAHVILNRPEKLNPLGIGPGSSRDEIARALAAASLDDSIGSVLIRANGRAFCGGGDLGSMTQRAPDTAYTNQLFNEEILRFNAGIRAVRKPVIVAVHGLCLGTALGFISQCDFVIAAETARFGLIEGRIGHPGASDLVPVIGPAWTKYLIFTGEALHLNKVSIETVMEAPGRAAGRLAGRAQDAITKTTAPVALAPDGRRFEDILRTEGIEGMKRARELQYKEPWLDPLE